MPEDYYALLGVDRDASEDAILRAYREKAAEVHPDVSDAPDAEGDFQRLNRAKSILTDPERRRAYDRLGHESFEAAREGEPESTPARRTVRERPTRSPSARWPPGFGRFGWGQLTFGGLGSLLGGVRPREPRHEAAASETGRVGAEPTGRECPKCRGRGTFVHVMDTNRGRSRRVEPCERCGGAGTVPEA